jgi:hypothetical protein
VLLHRGADGRVVEHLELGDEVRGDLEDEAARRPSDDPAAQCPRLRAREDERLTRARHADVKEAPLLLDVLRRGFGRARVEGA